MSFRQVLSTWWPAWARNIAPSSADDFGTLAALIALCVPAYFLLVLA